MKKRLKVLYVHHSGIYSGASKSLSYVIKNLDKFKYIPYLLNIERGPVNIIFKLLPVLLMQSKGIRPFHGSTVVQKSLKLFIRNWVFLIPSIIRANILVRRINPDLIHLNSSCLFVFAIVARWNKIKVICHLREPLRNGIWGAPIRFFCQRFVDGFISICKNDLDSMKFSKNFNIPCKVIYNFVETVEMDKKSNFLKSELGIKSGDIVFLYLARFASFNGWKKLISMGEKLVNEHPNFHFVLVGAQKESDFIYNRKKNFYILPFKQDVTSILLCSDIFVCPFTEPHFARGVIEASASGLPVIGSNIGGVDELVIHNETGYLYSSEKEFINYAIELGANENLRKKMGMSGRLLSEKRFNLEKNLKSTYEFYELFF
ncbi:glycosyltransferase family 4 protein [Cyclobacterium salsum]|uniref:glycosyltransferase family 4 protein n=1 Tax=Cyclobacterium salsum TaxID=2666329 RepID=UPI0013909CB6|nr:glycosyltransferase family 4 protein [Cyclobacterium salsum]